MTTFTGISFEGNLFTAELIDDLVTDNTKKGQTSLDFGLNKSDNLEDEIALVWGDIKTYWTAFQTRKSRLKENDAGTSLTREYWVIPLLEILGYHPAYQAKGEVIDGQTYGISHRSESGENKPPIHIIGCRSKLQKKQKNIRISAHALMQDYLNKTEHLWGMVTNGLQWRLLRDCSLMTRLSYIEFDLEQILKNENFAEFRLFYRLFHRTRLPENSEDADKCLLEFYHQETIQQGGRVRDRLRDGVEKALQILGTGFLQHPKNESLREQISLASQLSNSTRCEQTSQQPTPLTASEYYRQILLLIYRLLFLMVAESRNLLLIGEDLEKARIYNEYYSITRLRILADRPRYRREGFQDIWQGLRVTFRLFDENWRGELLNLSPLNGDLFGSQVLETLDGCAIDNYDLLSALRELSLYMQKGQLRRVNYAAIDVEELGSVYESLLDFTPQIKVTEGIYQFKLVAGSDRKTTGSYYTPPELVAQLIKSALLPVIEDRLKQAETQTKQEVALLSIKVCDPACGSGHFLLAAARRIGTELARVRTKEAQPSPEEIRQGIRDVIQNCIYGVDINPLAVDLCKVALWIEGFNRGKPLNFLDHRIKCGNSLVGVLDLNCLSEGIPDNAYKAVTGDDKKVSGAIKKQNKKDRDNKNQLSLFEGLEEGRSRYSETAIKLGAISEDTTGDVRNKQNQYQKIRQDKGWWRDYSACNLWTAAFFTPLTQQNLQLLPTTAALFRLLRGNSVTEKIVEAANKLAKEKRFFHWCLEFPEVFEDGGFSCVLGNPPWERIKLQEKEFFASKDVEIANAKNKAARSKLIKQLGETNPNLLQEFEDAKYYADAHSKFIRESDRFPLTSRGDINTYAVFAETNRKLISSTGRLGIIIPTGIATDNTTKNYFSDLIKTQSLGSLTGFENEAFIFPSVHHALKFCTLTVTGENRKVKQADFIFFARYFSDIDNLERHFNLSSEEIALINPNTLTCPIFRTKTDAEITKKIYHRIPVLENEKMGKNPWGISFMRMFDMANDSGLFKDEFTDDLVLLYEAKMFHQFDHRYSTYENATQANLNAGILPQLTDEAKQDPNLNIEPRYWVDKKEVENKLADKWNNDWLIAWRDITNSTSERTAIFSLLPKVAVGHTAPLIFTSKENARFYALLLVNLNSLVLDFVARQKIGGTHLTFSIFKQLPVIPPKKYTEEDIEYISSRVLKLVYTAWDMQPFAKDMGYEGEPFIWNESRRAILRAELDAYYAKLYGLNRDELRYILDPADVYGDEFPSETFRVLKNNEINKYDEYRTQRLVLEAWDRLFR